MNYLDLSRHAQLPQIDSEYIVVESAFVIRKLCQTEYIAARVAKNQGVFDNLRKAVDLSRESWAVERLYKWGHNAAMVRPALFSVLLALCDHPSLRPQLVNRGVLKYCVEQLTAASASHFNSENADISIFKDALLQEEETYSIISTIVYFLGVEATTKTMSLLRDNLQELLRFAVLFIEFTHRAEATRAFGLFTQVGGSLVTDISSVPWSYLVKDRMVQALCDIIEYFDEGKESWVPVKATSCECLLLAVSEPSAKTVFTSRCQSKRLLDSFEALSAKSVPIFRCFSGERILVHSDRHSTDFISKLDLFFIQPGSFPLRESMIDVLLNHLLSNDLGASELAANFLLRIVESGSRSHLLSFSELSEEVAAKAKRALTTLFDCHCARVRSRELLSLGTAVAAASAILAVARGHPASNSDLSIEGLFSALANLAMEAIERVDTVQERHVTMLWTLLSDCSHVDYLARILGNPRTFDLLVSCLRLGVSVLRTNGSNVSKLALVEECVERAVTVIARLCVGGGAIEEAVRKSRVLESIGELFKIRPTASSVRVLMMMSSLSVENSDNLANCEGLLGAVITYASKAVSDPAKSMGERDYDAVHTIVSLTSNLLRTSYGMSNSSGFMNEFRTIAVYLTRNGASIPDSLRFSSLSLARLIAMTISAHKTSQGDKVLVELSRACLEVLGRSHDMYCIELVSQ